MQGRQTARDYLSYGLNPVPLTDKIPQRKDWPKPLPESELDNYDFDDIGICTGIVSAGLEAIDFDLKYAEEGNTIMKEYQEKVGGDLIQKLVIQSTQNGGFHIIYRCSELEGNRILAKNSDGEVIIETRGDGGFVKCYPSKGYKMVRGSFADIPIITPIERNKLFAAAYRFDDEAYVKHKKDVESKESKFPKFDNDSDKGLSLLFEAGWTEVYRDGDWVEMRRPGKTEGISGGYNLNANFFYVHSTSTGFKERTPYNNVGIYAILKCKGDFRVAYARLAEQGYGEILPESSDSFENSLASLSFLSQRSEEEEYLQQVVENLIPQGLSTGWPVLDEYFRLKANSINFGLGLDGVGKSLLMIHLAAASVVKHNWSWGMCLPENKTAMSRRRLIEALSGTPISKFSHNPKAYERYKRLAFERFHIVANQKHYTLKDVLLMGQRLYEYYGINGFLIDPYNFFKVGGGNAYGWNNEILSELRVFSEKYCSVYVMAHPSSEAPRTGVGKDGYMQAPSKYDIQGGADFPYRVDDFFILHRLVNHPDPETASIMQFIVAKLKETETGGKVHPKGQYSELKWDTIDGFMGYWDSEGNNPMFAAKMEKTPGGIYVPARPELLI